LLVLAFGLGLRSFAQQPVWQNIGIEQGLPDPNVTGIVKANDGKLYIGTAIGLFSYDGFTFHKIDLSPQKKISPYINCLITDGRALFVGARDALIRYDLTTQKTSLVFNPLNSIGGVMELYFNASKSKLYCKCHGGILIVNSNAMLQPLDSVFNRSLKYIRVVTDHEIQCYCLDKKIISVINHHESIHFRDPEILEACWWEKEQAWLVVKSDGLYLLNDKYTHLQKLPFTIAINPVENRWLYPDQNGGFWIQAAGRFAFLKSAGEKSPEFFENEPGNPFSFTSNTAQAFFTEADGTRWVGGDGTGLSYLTPQGSKILFLTNEQAGSQHFWCFHYEKETHKLLCGTTSGILEGTLENNKFENRKLYKPSGFDRFSVNAIVDLNEDEYLLSVFRAGYWTFNKQTRQFRPLTKINKETGTLFVFGIQQISGNRLALCTQNSAYILDKKTLKLTRFIQPVLHNYSIYSVLENSRKQFLLSGGFGLQIFNAHFTQEHYYSTNSTPGNSLPSNVIFDLYEVDPGKYLIATMGAGLCVFHDIDSSFHPVKLVTNPDNIFGIMKADASTYILTTSNGLCSYDLLTGKSVMLNKTNLMPFNDFNQSAYYHDADFAMAGGEKGMILVNSGDLAGIFNLPSEIIIRYGTKNIESLLVSPGKHSIKLELSLSKIVPLAKKKFRHRIVGLDDDWQSLPMGQNILAYNYLPPGKYTLEVELEDETGLYKTLRRTMPVIVKPFFYQTIWFRTLALILTIVIIFLIVRYFALMRLRWKLNRMDAERKIMLERSRISRELHDNLGSQLTYMISGLETTDLLLKRNKIDKTAHNLEKLQLAARESMQQLRDSIWALNPGTMTLYSLTAQFEKWLNRVTEPSEQLHCSITKPECTDFTIDPLIGLNIFRMMQEAVHNALKHSGATELKTIMNCDETDLTILITDNGRGILTQSEEGTGLSSMRQRAGSIKADVAIENGQEGGVRVVIRIDKNTLKG